MWPKYPSTELRTRRFDHSVASARPSKLRARGAADTAQGGSPSARYSPTPPNAASAATPSISDSHGSAAPNARSPWALADPRISAAISSPIAAPSPSRNHCAASRMPTG
ncbi:hypothetical protein Tfont_02536 [Tepidimonas fonticaldi]|uniref:Uncharacterized protein n=1 Tax=Tepidimonas fonticaldi TaxID=1101373 RepID=A0A554XG76_9BURK|nr:hypothetical protein Tfont_02536 [Tepidimonas fonticaldi]